MFCKNCGNQLLEGSQYCGRCGARVDSSTYISFDESPAPQYKKPRRNLLWPIIAGSVIIAGLLIYLGVRGLGVSPSGDPGENVLLEQELVEATEQPTPEVSEIPFAQSSGITVNWGEEPPDLDPQMSTDQVSFWILNATLEGLVRLGPDGNVGPGLAESWDISGDGLTYTFHLRDALWSDDTPITAGDFEYAWKRAVDPTTSAEYAYQFYHIVNAVEINCGDAGYTLDDMGVRALDDRTLEVELVRPTPFFLSLTSFITYMPAQQQAIERWGDDYATSVETMVFSGPFAVDTWIHEQELSLVKNERYWDADTVRLPSITGYMINQGNTTAQMYEAGELDIMEVGPDFLEQYQDSSEYMALPQATCWYLMYNCEDKYFSNLKIRKAFAYAVDAERYIENIRSGLGEVASGFTPSTMAGKEGSANFAEDKTKAGVTGLPGYDPSEAVRLFEEGLAEVGATRSEFVQDVTILGGDGDTWSTILQFLQAQFEISLGVRLRIEQLSFSERLNRYEMGAYQISYAGWGGDYNDPMTFLDMWVTDGGNNDAWWSNVHYDACIDTAINGKGDQRIDAMIQAEGILAEELPIYPLYWPIYSLVQKSHLHDVARFPVGADTDFKWAWVDSPEGMGF